jgi:hypothetical protein
MLMCCVAGPQQAPSLLQVLTLPWALPAALQHAPLLLQL